MLTLPPLYFANCTDTFSGNTPAQTNPGTAVTASATPHADGTAVSLIAACAHDVHYAVLGISNNTSGTNVDSASLMDLLVDPAGGSSWASLIDDLVCGFTQAQSQANSAVALYYAFPLWVKSGSSFGVQVRSAQASKAFRASLWLYGNPSRPDMWWCGQKVESLGIDAANSKGTDITPNSSSATFTWTNVGSTTSGRYGAIQFGQNGSDGTSTAVGYHAQIGVSSVRVPGTPTFYWNNSLSEVSSQLVVPGPIWCDIPSGTQMMVGACASTNSEVHDVALYGVY